MRSSFLPPWVIQAVGLILAVFFAVIWWLADRIEPTLLAFSGTLIGTGVLQQARRGLSNGKPDKEEGEVS